MTETEAPLEAQAAAGLEIGLRTAAPSVFNILASATARLPHTLPSWRAVWRGIEPWFQRRDLDEATLVALMSLAGLIPLRRARTIVQRRCVDELASLPPASASHDERQSWGWSESRRQCAARVLASGALSPRDEILFEGTSDPDPLVSFWLEVGRARITGDLRPLAARAEGMRPETLGWYDDGMDRSAGTLPTLKALLAPFGFPEIAAFADTAIGSLALCETQHQPECDDDYEPPDLPEPVPQEDADAIGQGWLSQVPWFDTHDPEPYQFMPNRLELMDRELAGRVATHILRARIGYRPPDLPPDDEWIDCGQLSAFAITPLQQFVPDFEGLFQVFCDAADDFATQHQAAAAAAYGGDVTRLLTALDAAFQARETDALAHAAKFLDLYTRYRLEPYGIPTWGGGGEPTDAPGVPEEVPAESIVRLAATVRGPESVAANEAFEVSISLTLDLAGTVDVVVEDPDWKTLPLRVILLADGATPRQAEHEISVDRETGTGACTIRLVAGRPGSISISVVFFHGSRLCGSLQHTIGTVPQSRPLGITTNAHQPDMSLCIFRAGQATAWRVVLSESMREALRPQELVLACDGQTLGDLGFSEVAEEFAAADENGTFESVLTTYGQQLAKLVPRNITEVLDAALAERKAFSIQLIVDDAQIPWELMTVERDGSKIPISAICPMARWSREKESSLTNRIPGYPFWTVTGSDELPGAASEAAYLETLGAARICHADSARFRQCIHELADAGGILHFAGHGSFSQASGVCSSIALADGAFSALAFSAAAPTGLRHSFVVLNACEVGEGRRVLDVFGGWEQCIQQTDCSGFLAPRWSVKDSIGSKFICEVLEAAVFDQVPVAEALRDARARAWRNADSVMAYVFYGDVTATVQ